MSKSIKTLIRLHKNDIDKQVAIISALSNQLDRLVMSLEALKNQLKRELEAIVPGFQDMTAEYIRVNKGRQALINSQISVLNEKIAYEQEILRGLFENKKKYETIEQKQLFEKQEKTRILEQSINDEVAIIRAYNKNDV